MPKPPSVTPKKIIQLLKKRGFVLDRTKGSHYIFINLETKKRVTVPFHRKDIPRGTLLEILRQAGINKEEIE